MPGASPQTRRVTNLNANWQPDESGAGRFEVMIITEDDQHQVLPVSPATLTALAALAQADTTLAWDPVNRTLIVANIVGTMPWTQKHEPAAPAPQRPVLDPDSHQRRGTY
jgi:hypothetical protein